MDPKTIASYYKKVIRARRGKDPVTGLRIWHLELSCGHKATSTRQVQPDIFSCATCIQLAKEGKNHD